MSTPITWVPPELDSYDTPEIIWQKINQIGLGIGGTPDPTVPAAPTNLAGTWSGGAPHLTWDDNSDNEAGFKLYRQYRGGTFTQYATISTPNAEAYDDEQLEDADAVSPYGYKILAYNAQGASGYSNSFQYPPAAYIDIISASIVGADVILQWHEQDLDYVTQYRVYKSTNSGGTWVLAAIQDWVAGTNTWTDAGSSTGTETRQYYVVPVNPGGAGPDSGIATMLPPTPVTDGLIGWYAARFIQGLGDSSPLTRWEDSWTSNNDLSQAAPALKPTYLLGQVNGLPAIYFPGTSQPTNTSIANEAPVTGTMTGFTVIAVIKTAPIANLGTTGSHPILALSGNDIRFLQTPNPSANENLFSMRVGSFPAGSADIVSDVPILNDNWVIITGRFVRSTKTLKLETGVGEAVAPVVGPGDMPVTNIRFRFGGLFPSGSNITGFNGQIAEALIYNRPLSDAEVLSVQEWLDEIYFEAASPFPQVVDGGVVLQADDETWHNVSLSGTGQEVILSVEQDAVAAPGWRAYLIHQVTGTLTNYKIGIVVGVDGYYVMQPPEETVEDFDYDDTDPLMLTSVDDDVEYPVTVYEGPEGAVVSVLTLPSAITDLDGTWGGSVVSLTYTETEADFGGLTLELFRSIDGAGFISLGNMTLGDGGFTDDSVEASDAIGFAQELLYKLRYTNSVGVGDYSNTTSVSA